MSKRSSQVAAVERQVRALELRKAGATYRQIAEALDLSPNGAYKAVGAGLKAVLAEPAEEVKKLELERLDALLMGVWNNATKGDTKSVEKALSIMERRSRLLGLDAPRKTELTGSDGAPLFDVTVDDLAAKFERLVNEQADRLAQSDATPEP